MSAKATGRYWGSADEARVYAHPEGDATVTLKWHDGATLSVDYASREKALDAMERLGFVEKRNRK